MPIYVLEPPVQYVHRYQGPVIERVLPLSEARKVCASKGAPADACAWISNGACHLVIPRNGPVRDRTAYRRHELAHLQRLGSRLIDRVTACAMLKRFPLMGELFRSSRTIQFDRSFPPEFR